MAILAAVSGLSVHVRVAGEISTEYTDTIEDASTDPISRCYIESNAGSEYTIETTVNSQFNMHHDCDSVIVWVSVDGEYLGGVVHKLSTPVILQKTITCSHTWTTSNTSNLVEKRRFAFVPLSTDDNQEDILTRNLGAVKSYGEIKVSIATAKGLDKVPYRPLTSVSKDSINVPEKLLKGKDLSHASSLTSGILEKPPLARSSTNHREIGTFYFLYRSRDALIRAMIIPRSPSRPPSTNVGDGLDGLSESDIRRLARERLQGIKDDPQEQRPVKREPGSPPVRTRPWKLVKLDDGKEAIDLSDE